MKFCWTTINVINMNESVEFYQEIVGLELNRRFDAGQGIEIAFLGNGETKVELICNAENKEIDIGKDVCLGFEVDSVDDMMTYIKEKGLSVLEGPYQPNPNIRFFYILDPNGLRIQFVENIVKMYRT